MFLPYARHAIEEDDVAAVARVLRGDWLTTGPAVAEFERAFAARVGAAHAVSCNSGTAALYLAIRSAGLGPGDRVVVPAITFLATASAAVLAGLEVAFADVDAETGLMEVAHAAAACAAQNDVRAILPVHLAGQVADPAALAGFAGERGLAIIEDACHALGTTYGEGAFTVGACRHGLAACFSLHPAKAIAAGEGGMIATNDARLAASARRLRNHGMSREPLDLERAEYAYAADGGLNPWYYEAAEISHNFRLSDIHCALGSSQLAKLDRFLARRRALVARYREALAPLAPAIRPVAGRAGTDPGWHLFCVLVDFDGLGIERRALMERLRARGIGTQVHYIPLPLQPFYRDRCGGRVPPGAMAWYRRTLSLPLFATMSEADVDRVVEALADAIGR